jgi:hypothetical protein
LSTSFSIPSGPEAFPFRSFLSISFTVFSCTVLLILSSSTL